MIDHRTRLILILVAIGLDLVAVCVAVALGASVAVLGTLGSPLAVLVPALVDASVVERRRRDPKVAAVRDDVRD